MFRRSIACALLLLVGILVTIEGTVSAQDNLQPQDQPAVHLRWGPRAGVSRYRLQLAADRNFHDIVFDRIIAGNDTEITDLTPGKYFWRIAPLTKTLGEFSSVATIEVAAPSLPRLPI